MDYKYINQLLERYWAAETTLEEEEILRTFFSQTLIPAELEQYRPLFVYEQVAKKTDVLGDDFDEKMLAMIGEEALQPHTEEKKEVRVKARTITLGQRLIPLFRAAAVVVHDSFALARLHDGAVWHFVDMANVHADDVAPVRVVVETFAINRPGGCQVMAARVVVRL